MLYFDLFSRSTSPRTSDRSSGDIKNDRGASSERDDDVNDDSIDANDDDDSGRRGDR
jgi:hypothetical protein